MKKTKPFIIIFVLICLWIVADSSTVVTYPNEFTVIKQFGKIVDVRETPGLSVKIPFIQKAEKIGFVFGSVFCSALNTER